MIWTGGGLFADYLPEETAREILGADRGPVIGGAINPTGQARPVPGGVRLSGRWSFASGCNYLTHYVVGCVMMDGDQPRLLDHGAPEVQAVFVPASACQIIDTWHTAGLRGTGSHDFSLDDVFVPGDRVVPLFRFFAGPTPRPSTGCRTPFADIAPPGIAAVGFGIARDAIESFKQLALAKKPALGTTTLAQQHTMHQRVGQAEAMLRAARAYLYSTVQEVTAAHQAGAPTHEADAAALRRTLPSVRSMPWT